ncbi:fosmidomycin resistance protein [Halogeometricum borinquense]|uniref:Fosmidomycin resistance protein n=1 Tax=Halogeometricum borinquense TaxID=60847 RepID=A0A6C0UIU4_9EURY|nr:fosmidomycin resistance protein [Halogeometricum borinquense]QIB74221.1 fosmidomycin resistance protein [Halogeometricum borinquense]QIQ76573.1 fosmidomycin resistance protein [Halogeometricum borinquense]
MLTRFCRLGLEVKYLEAAREFYETRLGLVPTNQSDTTVTYDVGQTTVVLRRPVSVPRGGVHTHYAFSTTREAYDDWMTELSDLDPAEFTFGSSHSLYVYDADGNCVEIGGIDEAGEKSEDDREGVSGGGEQTPGNLPLTGLFEVVLEVTDLERAEAQFRALGFEVVDRGDERPRVRLSGPVDLELWEPQLGIADARGGLHVELAFRTDDPHAAVEAGGPWAVGPEEIENGLRVRDADGHVIEFVSDC